MIEVIHSQGDDSLAKVYVGKLADGSCIEFVESVQPPKSRDEKWVLIVSTLKGCPVGCVICDAGGDYKGKLSADEIFGQIDTMVDARYPNRYLPMPKFKIQFARMGDPALNNAVLDVLEELPKRYDAPGLLPSISTIAPVGRDVWFDRLLSIKEKLYGGGRFQMQFSLHSTNPEQRRKLIPIKTWTFEQMAEYGRRFYSEGDQRITLNFAPSDSVPLEPQRLSEIFDPEIFLIKLTPINPTGAAAENGLRGLIDPDNPEQCKEVISMFENVGYHVLLSIGDQGENAIGSNCGLYVSKMNAQQ